MNNLKNTWAKDYTVVSNTLVNCFGISPMTRFLCIYLSCQSNSFTFTNSTLCKALDCSEATLRKYMKEAMSYGLIKRDRITVNGKFGYFSYTLVDPTTLQFLPDGKKTSLEKNQAGKSIRLNKEESIKQVRKKKQVREATPSITFDRVEATKAPSPNSAPPPSPDDVVRNDHPETLPKFEHGSPECFDSIISRVAESLSRNQDWSMMASRARLKMTKEQFFDELKQWVTRNQNSYQFYLYPVKQLRGGRSSFQSWLGNEWSRKKYGETDSIKEAAGAKATRRGGPIRKTQYA